MELKDWVRSARKNKGWTLAQLGEAVGRTKANVGHWESGTHAPSYAQIKQIADATGYPMPETATVESGSVSLTAAREQVWPFKLIDRQKIFSLGPDDALRLEGAMLMAASQLRIDISAQAGSENRRVA